MKRNMGTIDRIVRVAIAAIIGYLFFTKQFTGTLGTVLIIFAAVFAVTSVISFCPLYFLLGLKTTKREK